MAGSEDPQDDAGYPPEEAQDFVREEARNVVSEQLQTLRDTDQKAMATARINGLILGVLASAASLSDNATDVVNVWIVIGGGILLGSLCVSILTYTIDRPSYGVGPGYFDATLDNLDTVEEVQKDMLARYADWIENNSEEISTNGSYLLLSQLLFIFGLLSLGYGVYNFL